MLPYRIRLILNNIKFVMMSLFYRKDSRVVLFGSWFGERFADNSRFLYQYLHDKKKELGLSHVVWITRKKNIYEILHKNGYEVYMIDSPESIKYHKIAKYHFVSNSPFSANDIPGEILGEYSFRAIRINLWHGVLAFKGVRRASREYLIEKNNHRIQYYLKELFHKNAIYRKICEQPGGWGDCYYLSTTEYNTKNVLTKFFQLPKEKFIETSPPRVSYNPLILPEEEKVIEQIKNYQRVILYLPTFRTGDTSFDFYTASEGLKDFLKENDILWVQKVHSASKIKNDSVNLDGNILNLPHDFDINLSIPMVSAMVSDYSSATGEAMFFYKPIIFFVPDFQEYKKGDRGFIVDPEEIMCGPIVNNVDDLKHSIEGVLNGDFSPDEKYLEIRERYFGAKKNMNEIWNDIIFTTK